MSQNNVTKIKRLISKLKTIDEVSKIISAIDNRRIVVRNREIQRLDEQTWQWVKYLKPGDALVQCTVQNIELKSRSVGISSSWRHDEIGNTYTVVKVLPRRKELVLRNWKGAPDRFPMERIRSYGLTRNPPEDIAALALQKKIAVANGEKLYSTDEQVRHIGRFL